ncbi:MAG: hypothetical protein O2875_01765 [Planctomycetota bacterium]|nr:hypothetical protein [Planctomycetota bacterium]MDA1263291.1 hypothetical protein [Planctomycetota bacterium]
MKQLDPKSIAAQNLANGRFLIRLSSQADIEQIIIPRMRNIGWNPGIHDV